MRGKVEKKSSDGAFDGITPAYAGKSFTQCEVIVCVWDHPRVCGEKLLGTM